MECCFCSAILAHILSLFFRFILEQLTECEEIQQKGKEASPAEQIGERGQAPPGPLSSGKGKGYCRAVGSSSWPKTTPPQPKARAAQPSAPRPVPRPAAHLVSSIHTGPTVCSLCPTMYLVSATHPVSPAPTRSSVVQPCLFPMPQAPCTYLMPPPCLSLACTHLGSPPLTQSHHKLCARSCPLVLCLQSASDGFWKSVATRVPKEPPEIRILNPYFIQEAAFTLIGLPFNNGLMGRGVRCLDPGRGSRGPGPEVPWEGRTGRQGGDRGFSSQEQSSALESFAEGLSLTLHPLPLHPEHPDPRQCGSDHGTTRL